MFDNAFHQDASRSEAKLRNNLRRFDRDSLKILHPLFRDALRLLARKHVSDKRETLLLPLVRSSAPLLKSAPAGQVEIFPVSKQDRGSPARIGY